MRTDSFLDSCAVEDDTQEAYEPFVGFPQKPFQLRPGRVSQLIYLHNRAPGGWYAVTLEIVDQIRLPNLWKGRLYEGVTADGQPFLLPATLATRPEYLSWQRSLDRVIQVAQSGKWVSQRADRGAQERIATIETRIRHAPAWFPGSLDELLQTALAGRVIDEKHPLVVQKGRSRQSYEEIVEEYPPY